MLIPPGQGGQHFDSMVKCEQITSLEKAFLVDDPLGRPLVEPLMDEVARATPRAVGEVVP